mmetsp:Transcript_25153/g.51109  ORF Transcript_25153/g.51109 Transcript_25153/m.51109 type:complete len:326 (-) Transcript_25153:611-1588(-)
MDRNPVRVVAHQHPRSIHAPLDCYCVHGADPSGGVGQDIHAWQHFFLERDRHGPATKPLRGDGLHRFRNVLCLAPAVGPVEPARLERGVMHGGRCALGDGRPEEKKLQPAREQPQLHLEPSHLFCVELARRGLARHLGVRAERQVSVDDARHLPGRAHAQTNGRGAVLGYESLDRVLHLSHLRRVRGLDRDLDDVCLSAVVQVLEDLGDLCAGIRLVGEVVVRRDDAGHALALEQGPLALPRPVPLHVHKFAAKPYAEGQELKHVLLAAGKRPTLPLAPDRPDDGQRRRLAQDGVVHARVVERAVAEEVHAELEHVGAFLDVRKV